MNPFCDKYFTKSKLVARAAGLNPIVKYRFFMRTPGLAAFEPFKILVKALCPDAIVSTLPEGMPFEAKDTVAIVEAPFQGFVEHETQTLQWLALPSYCALEAEKIVAAAKGRPVLDFAARHMYDPTSTALASYGAKIGGIKVFSTDIGAGSLAYLRGVALSWGTMLPLVSEEEGGEGKGTTPHALLAILGGDYIKLADAYTERFPDEKFTGLIDYNNKEVGDSLLLLKHLGKKFEAARIDTCGENYAQVGFNLDGTSKYADERGVSLSAVRCLKNALNLAGGEHVEVVATSGFSEEKTKLFVEKCPSSVQVIGTGQFIPKGPTATADIFEVDGKRECKVGREWGFKANAEFLERI